MSLFAEQSGRWTVCAALAALLLALPSCAGGGQRIDAAGAARGPTPFPASGGPMEPTLDSLEANVAAGNALVTQLASEVAGVKTRIDALHVMLSGMVTATATIQARVEATAKGVDASGDTNFGWAGISVAALLTLVCVALVTAQRRTILRLAAEHRVERAAADARNESTVRRLVELLELDERGDQAREGVLKSATKHPQPDASRGAIAPQTTTAVHEVTR